MTTPDLSLFQENFKLARGTTRQKMTKAPLRMLWSKALEFGAIRLGIGVKSTTKLPWGDRMTVVYPQITSLAISAATGTAKAPSVESSLVDVR